jgi:hypothetical protein
VEVYINSKKVDILSAQMDLLMKKLEDRANESLIP